MSLFVRPVDLDNERDPLLQILQRNLPDLDHAARYRWRYLENPAGRAYAWFLCDGTRDRVVGAAVVIPRYTWIGDELVRSGQVGDFAVDVAYRSLGPAIYLQRATFTPVDAGELAFCYDCPPHERGMATFHRLGLRAACRVERFSKPLRVERLLRTRIPVAAPLRSITSILLNAALRIRDFSLASTSDISVSTHTGTFESEFTEMDQRIAKGSDLVRNRRYAQDLEWRFRHDPLLECEVITARRGGLLIGFVAYAPDKDRAHLVDLSANSPFAAQILLRAATRRARKEGREAIDSLAVPTSSMPAYLRRAGFFQRETAASVVPYAHDDLKASLGARSWSFFDADVMG